MTYRWPTRAEWMADAEPFIRTLVHPRERVPSRADHYLDADELDRVIGLLTKHLSRLRQAAN